MNSFLLRSHKLNLTKCGVGKTTLMTMVFALFLAFGSKGAALSGTYTICGSGCSYSSFASAASALSSNGVNGAVTFNVATGSYNEAISISSISGASSTNTITFKGAGKGSTRLYNALSSNSAVVMLSGASYVSFQDMTIEYTGTSSLYTVYLSSANYNSFKNCKLLGPVITSVTAYPYVIFMNSSNYNTFDANIIRGGYYTIYMNNYSSNYTYGNNTLKGNKITQGYQFLMYVYGSFHDVFDGNILDSATYTYSYGVYSYYAGGSIYRNNQFLGTNFYYAMLAYYSNNYGSNAPFLMYNNIIGPLSSNTYYGVAFFNYNYATNFQIYHNTFATQSSSGYVFYAYTYGTSVFDLRNNIFYNSGSATLAYLGTASWYTYLDGNDWYKKSGGVLMNYASANYSDVPSFKTAAATSGFAANDLAVNVNFASSTDYHVDQNKSNPYSPFMGLTTDVDGDSRCKLYPTTGADESNFGKGPVVANFFGPDTVFYGSPAIFYNSAKAGEPKIFAWYINGVKVTDSIHLETTSLKGPVDKIKLVVEGCGGKDSIEKLVVVDTPSVAPTTDFIADKNTIMQGFPAQWDPKLGIHVT